MIMLIGIITCSVDHFAPAMLPISQYVMDWMPSLSFAK